MTGELPPLELRPDRRAAAGWSGAALAALGAFSWAFVDSEGHPIAWIAVTFAGVVAAYFLAQLLAPSRFAVRLDQDGVTARFLASRPAIAWDRVHLARVTTLAGEPYLELHLRERGPSGRPRSTQVTGVVLPVGCDLSALHSFLADRLGRGGPRRRRTFPLSEPDEEQR